MRTSQADDGGGDTTDSATNTEGPSLTVPQEEDKVSHGSRSSTAFATPKTGMTPTSSENEADSKDEKRWSGVSTEGSNRNGTLNHVSVGVDGQVVDQSSQEQGAMVPTSSEGERESNSLASISTPSLDRLQLPTVDRPLEKSDDHSCSTLTGSQGSLLLNDSASKTTNLQQSSTNSSLGPIAFNSKTATASPRVTKAVAKPTGVTTNHMSINNTDVNGDGAHAWPADDVISSAAFTNRPSPPVSSSSMSAKEKYPQRSTSGADRINSHHEIAGSINGMMEEESHSAGSGSFSSTLVDTVTSTNRIRSPPPPYELHNQHTVFNAHTAPPPSHDGQFQPYHSTISSTGVSTSSEQLPGYTSTGTSSNSRSNGIVPRFEQAEQKGKMLMPRQLSLADQERSSPEQYYSPMSRKFILHGYKQEYIIEREGEYILLHYGPVLQHFTGVMTFIMIFTGLRLSPSRLWACS